MIARLSANVSGPRPRRLLAHADRRTLDMFVAPCPADQVSRSARRVDERRRDER
jgi:hypothetical protein